MRARYLIQLPRLSQKSTDARGSEPEVWNRLRQRPRRGVIPVRLSYDFTRISGTMIRHWRATAVRRCGRRDRARFNMVRSHQRMP